MKTFREFITEVYDPDVVGKSQIRKQGEGGRVGRMRKQSEPEKFSSIYYTLYII